MICRHFPLPWFVVLWLSSVNLCLALDLKTDISLHGTVSVEDGLVVAGKYIGDAFQRDFKNIWLPKSTVNFTLQAVLDDRLKIVIEPELQIWYNTFLERWTRDLSDYRVRPQYSIIIQNGYGEYSLGGIDDYRLRLAVGTFLFKYNHESVNLGEYLFRTGCYPGNITNEIDFPYARLTGIHLSSILFTSLRQDLMFTREQEVAPLHDWSLSYVAGYSAGRFLDIGAGVSLWRILPSDDSSTTPRFPVYTAFLKSAGDTGYYSFSGTKLMARATFDPKPLLGSRAASILGAEDLKIFAEAAILGLKNYDVYKDTVDAGGTHSFIRAAGYYDSLWQRVPVMFGMNLPTFRLLDRLALQVEWYGSRWPVGPYCRKYDEIVWPTPPLTDGVDVNAYSIGRYDYHGDDWKWTVYAKRTVASGFSIMAQVARDHLKHRVDRVKMRDETDMLPKPSHWYWAVKVQYAF